MTKAQAKKRVQEILTEAKEKLDEAALIMDEHGFSVSFMDFEYMPRGAKLDEDEGCFVLGEAMIYAYETDQEGYDDYLAGQWKSSSEYRGC